MTSDTNVKVQISEGQKDKLKKHLNQIASLSQFISRLPIWTVKTLLPPQNHNLVD